MSNTSGYISLAVIGGVVAALIAGGAYYASDDNKLAPTGMSAYRSPGQNYYGGRKTHRRKKHGRKSRKH
jgi:hypothetical protein